MTTYTIEPRQSLFKPWASLWPRRVWGCTIKAVLGASCWWSAEDWQGDKDRNDLNKLGGITAAFSRNNYRSALIAWRPADVHGTFIATGYTNDRKGNWKYGKPKRINSNQQAVQGIDFIVFHADEVLTCEIELHKTLVNTQVLYRIENERGESVTYYHQFDAPWHGIYREIGPNIGGANNSPGPFGGRAHKYMRLYKEHKWIN